MKKRFFFRERLTHMEKDLLHYADHKLTIEFLVQILFPQKLSHSLQSARYTKHSKTLID